MLIPSRPIRIRAIIGCLLALSLVNLCAVACAAAEKPGPIASAGVSPFSALPDDRPAVSPEQGQQALRTFDLSPAVFTENKGQWDTAVRYGFDGKGVRVSFTDSGPVFQMLKSERATRPTCAGIPCEKSGKAEFTQTVFSATFVGARTVRPVGLDPSSSRMNFFLGNDRTKWQSGVPTYSKVLYKGLYDGVDLCTWGKRSGLKYEFHVSPGASWERIVIRYDGIDGLSVDGSGALHVKTGLGEIVDKAPLVYQETAEGRKEISSGYRVIDKKSYGFKVTGNYDRRLPLVLDPDLQWASYLGGSGYEGACGIAIDSSGNVWVTGPTWSNDFPIVGGFQTSYSHVFVARITPDGTLAWSSYLGGTVPDLYSVDWSAAIAFDASGNAWVVGITTYADFPTPGGFDTTLDGDDDAFVARITPSGMLAWASYLGGSADEACGGIAIDASGNAWVTGGTTSPDFPTPGGFKSVLEGDGDAFVARIAPSGTLDWASALGGSSTDGCAGIAIDASGNAWVTGTTSSSDFPTPGGFQTSPGGLSDAFIARVTPSGTLDWASYLGGSGDDTPFGIAIDTSGNVWVMGYTRSLDFPTPGGFDTSLDGISDAFVARITPSGALDWASFLGGSAGEGYVDAGGAQSGGSITCDSLGNAWVTGMSISPDFPTPGGFQTSPPANWDLQVGDAFVAKVTQSGRLEWASYLGGDDRDGGMGIAVDASGNVWVAGYSWSSDFPTPGGFDTTNDDMLFNNPCSEGFVAKISPLDLNWLTVDNPRMVLPQSSGHDSFSLQGSFQMWYSRNVPDTVTLTIDGWSVVMDAASWKRVGKSNTYVYKQGGVTGRITYWVNGTKKCLFSFTGSKQTLLASLPHLPSMPVRLQLGRYFDETVTAEMSIKNHVARLSSLGPLPVFRVDKLSVTRNLHQPGRDGFKFSGKLFLARDLEPASDGITMVIGPYAVNLPAGTLPAAKKGVLKYTAPTANGKLTFQFNTKTHVLTVTATGIDLSSLTQATHVSLAITNHAGAHWDYGLFLAVNKKGTAYKY